MGEEFIMNINDYQNYVAEGASEKYDDLNFAALAMVGEVGEVCDIIKKKYIYTDSPVDLQNRIKDEMGDVLWQFVALANAARLNVEDIINFNVEKLNQRHGGATLDLTGGKR